MKNLVSLSAAVFLLAACTEATAPTSADLTLREGRQTPPPPVTVVGSLTNDFYSFEPGTSTTSSAGSAWAEDNLTDAGFNTASPGITTAYNGSTSFMGRKGNTSLFLIVPNAGTKYSLAFDLYIIGSWDGQGQQAQQGAFGHDIWRTSIRCGAASAPATQILLETDFSNQETVQQSYPMAATQKGGNRAGTGSYAKDILGFRNDPSVNTPLFRSYGDIEYHMTFTGTNPCAAGQTAFFTFTVPDAGLQSNYDESWGLDNVAIKTD